MAHVELIDDVADFFVYSNMNLFQWSRKRAKKANDRGQMFDVAMKHNADIESIFDMKRFGGDIKYLVQYKGYKELEWMPATTIQRTDPLKVIEFYESCITWEN